jgi:hypothetical protein
VAIVSLLLALQSAQRPDPDDPYTVALGRLAQYWVPRFKGEFRVGSTLRLVDDLAMPDRVALAMYSGGDIGVSIKQAVMEKADLLFVAEYWTHQWSGFETLRTEETLRDVTFPAGSPVDSRFTLSTLTLDITGAVRDGPFQGGLTFSLQGTSARLRMDAPAQSSKETIKDLRWGGGVFVELHPVPALFFGLSARGFTSFRHPTESGTGDFRGYLGLQWGILRLEGGYRVWIHDLDTPDEGLHYLLYGPYIAAGLAFRF